MDKFEYLSLEDFKKLNDGKHFWNNGYHCIIDCNFIQTWEQFAETLGNTFQLPMRNEQFNGTWDWMTDLSWLGPANNINIYLYNEEKMFHKDNKLKTEVLHWLNELIQFWQVDVKAAFIAGKPGVPKNFKIYIIN